MKIPRKIFLYGGAFDPPHNGHLSGIKNLLRDMETDELWICPSGRREDKQYKSSDRDRLALVHLFVDELKNTCKDKLIKVFDRQLTGDIDSYAIDLVNYFTNLNKPEDKLYYIIGSDILPYLDKWKDFPALSKLVTFVVLQKPSHVYLDQLRGHDVIWLSTEGEVLSSTKIRSNLKNSLGIYGMVPDSIYHYIRQNRLYKDETLYSKKYLSIKEYEGWEYVERVNCEGVAVVIPITAKGELILIEQYRPPVKRNIIELPAGLVGDLGKEEFNIAALRELQEETTYTTTIDKVKFITELPSSAGLTSETSKIFVAKDCVDTERGQFGEEERGRITNQFKVSFGDLNSFLIKKEKEGKLIDPKVYVAINYIKTYLK